MGRMKEEAMEREQEKVDKELARRLGLSYDELIQLEYEFNENTSNDGLVYDIYLSFDESNSKEIMNKIIGLDSSNCVSLGPNGLE